MIERNGNVIVAQVRPAEAVTLGQLASAINAEHANVEESLRDSVAHARRAGQLLVKAKSLVRHGEWLSWLQAHCRVATRTAQAYMRVAKRWDELQAKAQGLALLTFEESLRLLATPAPEQDQNENAEADFDLADLTFDGRIGVRGGFISMAAAKDMLRLRVYDRIAGKRPSAANRADEPYAVWSNLLSKKIVFNPYRARTDDDVRAIVDDMLYDLLTLDRVFKGLPADEARRKAEAATADPGDDLDGRSPEYYVGQLYLDLLPDFSRLSSNDRLLIVQAAARSPEWQDVGSETPE